MASGSGRRGSGRRKSHDEEEFRGREIVALSLIAIGVFLTVAALSFRLNGAEHVLGEAHRNWGGAVGHHLGGFFVKFVGLGCYPLFAFAIYWGLLLFLRREVPQPHVRAFGAICLTIVLSVFLAGPELRGTSARMPFGLGGGLGHFLAPKLYHSLGQIGVGLLLFVGGLTAFLVATNWPLHALASDLQSVTKPGKAKRKAKRKGKAKGPAWLDGLRNAFAKVRASVGSLFEPAAATATASVAGRSKKRAPPPVEEEDEEEIEEEDEGEEEYEDEYEEGDGEEEEEGEDEADDEADEEEYEEDYEEDDGEYDEEEEGEEDDETDAEGDDEYEPEDDEPSAQSTTKSRSGANKAAAAVAAVKKREQQSLMPIHVLGTPSSQSKKRNVPDGPYLYPTLDLLEPVESNNVADKDALRKAAESIERRLKSHGLDAQVVCISAGPAVTVFELELAEGLRVSSVTKYSPDLAAALKAYSVRVVAPIPGKHTVGVEVPNETRSLVRLRELCEFREPGKTKEIVPLLLGRDVAGKPLIEDLARMPHLLIAGATGSGKSVCINAVLLSILLTKSPDDVRVILIDPKMVELQNYKTIPHLLCPVVTSMKQVPRVLDWSIETMEQRYTLLSSAGVRNLKDYNALGEDKLRTRLGSRFDPERTPVSMPAIVVIIDEFADLMAVAAAEVEVSIQRLAQKSRAVGIHVILATQRPSRDVITGLIKANLPTRIAFQVSSRVDSRVVLDSNGAEQLLGHGDMLYIPPGTNRLVRAQGTYVSDEEIHEVVTFLEQTGAEQSFEQTLVQVPTGKGRKAKERDELYEEAVRALLEEQRGSATLLQRKLSIGYTRASRLIELMCEDGIVGDFVGSKSREVLMSLEDWEAQQQIAESAGREGEEALLADYGNGLDEDEAAADASGEVAATSESEDAPIENLDRYDEETFEVEEDDSDGDSLDEESEAEDAEAGAVEDDAAVAEEQAAGKGEKGLEGEETEEKEAS